jgi:hypothetical protein
MEMVSPDALGRTFTMVSSAADGAKWVAQARQLFVAISHVPAKTCRAEIGCI